jgi:hypothetical protein
VKNNAYDLVPLTRFLTQVAKAFPNAYPRIVDKAASKALTAQLADAGEDETAKALS